MQSLDSNATTRIHPMQAMTPADLDAESQAPSLADRLRDLALSALVVLLCALCAAWQPAAAAQLLDIRDGDTAIARISIRDQTRLRAERGRLLDVIGDVYDAQKNPGGRIIVLKDPNDGEFYVKPVQAPPGVPQAPVKLDVKTERGTVGLLLQPAEVIGDTLTLRVSGGVARAANEDNFKAKAAPHLRAIKALTLAMASPELAGEIQPQRLPAGGEVVALWQEARFVLKARYEAAGLLGESYELTNISQERMVIDERELYRPGVLSVGVKVMALAPGQTTAVWIVRLLGDQD